MKKRVGILIPVANEQRTIREFTECLLSECERLSDYQFCVFYIMDSYSKDSTQAILENDFREKVSVLFHENSTGLVSSYIHGYKHCIAQGYDYIVEMDSGFSHKPEHLGQFLARLDAGDDAVFATRFSKDSLYKASLFRKAVSRLGTVMANVWLGMDFSDATSGYQAFKRTTLEELEFDNFISYGGMFQTEIKYYVYDRRSPHVERELEDCKQFVFYGKRCRRFFSRRILGESNDLYRYKISDIPIEFVMSDSSFKSSWIFDAIKILLKLEQNSVKIYKERKEK
jgi:dolichol-phosphate mannosyltransferase